VVPNKGNFMETYEIVSEQPVVMDSLNGFAATCHLANMKWWTSMHTGQLLIRNKGELLMLIVTEIAEAMEGVRKDCMDDKLPHRKMEEVELADALIRIFDYAAAHKLDLSGAFAEKMAYNATRADHTHAARLAPGGKKI
jgi:NTP pyrophosphatase (non-canonical NTP hydrolase)